MSQAVELSDILVSDAQSSADLADRSLAGQIEFWAEVGRAIESTLHVDEVNLLKAKTPARALSQCLREVGTLTGLARLKETLSQSPFPHYGPVADRPDYLLRTEEDGTRTIGRFVDRDFVFESFPRSQAPAWE